MSGGTTSLPAGAGCNPESAKSRRSTLWLVALAGAAALTPGAQASVQAGAQSPAGAAPGWEVVDIAGSGVKVSLPCKSSELRARRGDQPVLYCAKPNYTAQLVLLDTSKSSFDDFVKDSDAESDRLKGDHRVFVSQGHRFASGHLIKGGVEFFSQITEVSPSKSILLGLMSNQPGSPANAEAASRIFASVEFADQ